MNDFTAAARDLRTLLTEENTALRRGDAAATPALVQAKALAAGALTAAAATAPRTYYTQALAEQLQELATENADLLQNAIAVQMQIITIVTRAARASCRASAHGDGLHDLLAYDQHGGDPRQAVGMALVRQA